MHHFHRLKEKIMSGDSKRDPMPENTQSYYPTKEIATGQNQQYGEKGSRMPRNPNQPLADITNVANEHLPTQEDLPTVHHQSSLPMTLMSSIPREDLEGYIKDANKRLFRKYKEKGCLNQEDVYIIKLKWLYSMIKGQKKLHMRDLTGFRMNIEKVLEEVSLSMDTQPFNNRMKVVRQLKRLGHFFSKLEPQKAILLDYKLFKMHLKQLVFEDKETKQELALKCYNFFIPYTRLMEIEMQSKESVQKKVSNFMTYQKIKKFLKKPDIADTLLKYRNPKSDPAFQKKFEVFLSQKIFLHKAMSVLTCKTYGMILQEPCEGLADSVVPHKPTSRQGTRKSLEDLDDVLEDQRHLENAKTIELDEQNNIIPMGEKIDQKQIPAKPKNVLGKAPSEIVKMKASGSDEDSSISEPSLSEHETDNELMNDPELYTQKKQIFKPPSPKNENRFKTMTASKFKVESTGGPIVSGKESEYIQPRMPLNRDSGKKHSTILRESFRTSDDLQLNVDPLRVSHRLDLIRVNSTNNLVGMEQQARKAEEERLPVRSSQKRPSVVHKQLTVTKTRQDIVFQKVLSIANDEVSKWDVLVNTPILRVMKIKPEDSPVVLLKAWALIEGFDVNEVFNQIYDIENRAKWDTVTVGLRVVEALTESSAVIYFYVKTPFGITERDFVQRRNFARDYPEKGMITMGFESCEHPEAPVLKKRIRGETHIAGYTIRPSDKKPNSTELILLSQVDIKGNIPKSIVNMMAGKAPAEWVNKLKKACERARIGKH